MKRFSRTRFQAFSLVEVTLALGIISFGLIAIMGLVPRGLGIVKDSADEAAALNILSSVSSDIQCIDSNATASATYQIPVQSVNSGKGYFDINGNWLGNPSTVPSDAVYALNWTIQARSLLSPPAAFISISWPAKSSLPQGSVECILVLPRNPT